MKKYTKIIFVVAFVVLVISAGITYAAFIDKGKVLGSQFSVGSADIKLLNDLLLGAQPSNLVDEKTGPSFAGIGPNWTDKYLMKIFNNSTGQIRLTSNSNYLTAEDPDDLRNIIFVEPFVWNDDNNNGMLDTGEEGTTYGRKTIVKWKTEGYDFGLVQAGETKSLILKFSTDSVSDTKQGKSALFDFEFNSTEE